MSRVISWFSCGAASAVASKIMLGRNPLTQITRIVLDNEHHDNWRFADDVSSWLGAPIIELRSQRYKDCWDVWERKRFIVGVDGAPCTNELKKRVRQEYQVIDDIHVFGYTANEWKRARSFKDNHPELVCVFPLIEEMVSKDECFEIIKENGLLLPEMYRLGYSNANCVGCPKGGMGYWNKIKIDFPEIYERMSDLEQKLGVAINRDWRKAQVFLKDLKPTQGKKQDLILPECGIGCPAEISVDPLAGLGIQ